MVVDIHIQGPLQFVPQQAFMIRTELLLKLFRWLSALDAVLNRLERNVLSVPLFRKFGVACVAKS